MKEMFDWRPRREWARAFALAVSLLKETESKLNYQICIRWREYPSFKYNFIPQNLTALLRKIFELKFGVP